MVVTVATEASGQGLEISLQETHFPAFPLSAAVILSFRCHRGDTFQSRAESDKKNQLFGTLVGNPNIKGLLIQVGDF